MDRSLMTAMKTMGMLGGMMGPMVAAAALMAAAKRLSYPSRAMAGSRTEETALASATAEPETPAMITFTMTVT
jgi:hypothetical protein